MEDAYLLLSLEGCGHFVRAGPKAHRRPPGKSFFGGRIHAVVPPPATKKDIFLSAAQPTHQGTESVVLVVFVVVGTHFISTEEQFFGV